VVAKTLTATSGVKPVYAILVTHGDEQMNCRDCGGEGTLDIHGSLKTCRDCGGLGKVLVSDEAQRVLREFRIVGDFTVSHEHSALLRLRGYDTQDIEDRLLQMLDALAVSRIKARIVFPVF